MPSLDEFTELRRRVLRRCVYALNSLALRDDRVPPDGAFDAAISNGLAAIVAHESAGNEYEKNREFVKPAMSLLDVAKEYLSTSGILNDVDLELLEGAIDRIKPLRHGRADDEWYALGKVHVDILLKLDRHQALRILDLVDGFDFSEAATALYRHEVEAILPSNPKERSMTLDPAYCDNCGRTTLIVEDFHYSGLVPGAGNCIACGYERTEDEAEQDYLETIAARNSLESLERTSMDLAIDLPF